MQAQYLSATSLPRCQGRACVACHLNGLQRYFMAAPCEVQPCIWLSSARLQIQISLFTSLSPRNSACPSMGQRFLSASCSHVFNEHVTFEEGREMECRWLNKTPAHTAFITHALGCTLDISSKGRRWLSVKIVFTCGLYQISSRHRRYRLYQISSCHRRRIFVPQKFPIAKYHALWRRPWCLA